jgi:hypothetical protein
MTTGKKPASDAGRILRSRNSTKREKDVAASDLAQARKPAVRKSPRKRRVRFRTQARPLGPELIGIIPLALSGSIRRSSA